MGVIVDSTVLISAERRRESAGDLMGRILSHVGEQEVALSSVGYTELLHGIYRTKDEAKRAAARAFCNDLATNLRIYSYTRQVAELAGRIQGEQASVGLNIPFADLLIGATALSLNFAILTANERHFRLMPGLEVIAF